MVTPSTNLKVFHGLFRVNLIALPYLFYPALVGIFVVLVGLVGYVRAQRFLDPITRISLWGISALLILSCAAAYSRGEAVLQLTHFLPFFWLFGTLPALLDSPNRLEQLAIDLTIAALPINVMAIAEYLLKLPQLPTSLAQWPLVEGLRSAPHAGRAMVMFDHPNALASYLIVILGLGLGLSLKRLRHPKRDRPNLLFFRRTWVGDRLLYTATALNLFGIFASGSRNGILIAIAELLIFAVLARKSRVVVVSAAIAVISIGAGVAFLGLGDRPRAVTNLADDPRLGIWKIALDLIRERPWLGWGLGNFKFLYPPRLIDPDYQDVFHPHNFWLLLGSEAGLPVMVALTVLVAYLLYRGVRLLRSGWLSLPERCVLTGYFMAFGSCVAFALLDVTFYDARVNILNWFTLAGIYSLSLHSRNSMHDRPSAAKLLTSEGSSQQFRQDS